PLEGQQRLHRLALGVAVLVLDVLLDADDHAGGRFHRQLAPATVVQLRTVAVLDDSVADTAVAGADLFRRNLLAEEVNLLLATTRGFPALSAPELRRISVAGSPVEVLVALLLGIHRELRPGPFQLHGLRRGRRGIRNLGLPSRLTVQPAPPVAINLRVQP